MNRWRSTRIGKFHRPWIKRLIDREEITIGYIVANGIQYELRGTHKREWHIYAILYNNDSVISNITIERRAFACCDIQLESREYPMNWRDVKDLKRKRGAGEKKEIERLTSIYPRRRRVSWMGIIKCIANCRLYFRREGSLDSTIHQLSRKLTLPGS